jgi:hypothetical protein
VNADTYWQGIRNLKSEYYSMFNRANFEANEGRFGRACLIRPAIHRANCFAQLLWF